MQYHTKSKYNELSKQRIGSESFRFNQSMLFIFCIQVFLLINCFDACVQLPELPPAPSMYVSLFPVHIILTSLSPMSKSLLFLFLGLSSVLGKFTYSRLRVSFRQEILGQTFTERGHPS